MLFGAIFLLVLPYVLKHAINVRVDVSAPGSRRAPGALIDFCGHVIGLVPFCLLALWVNWDYALTSLFQKGERWGTWQVWEVWEQSPDAGGLPRAPVKVLVLVGFFCLLLQVAGRARQAGLRARRASGPGRRDRRGAADDATTGRVMSGRSERMPDGRAPATRRLRRSAMGCGGAAPGV